MAWNVPTNYGGGGGGSLGSGGGNWQQQLGNLFGRGAQGGYRTGYGQGGPQPGQPAGASNVAPGGGAGYDPSTDGPGAGPQYGYGSPKVPSAGPGIGGATSPQQGQRYPTPGGGYPLGNLPPGVGAGPSTWTLPGGGYAVGNLPPGVGAGPSTMTLPGTSQAQPGTPTVSEAPSTLDQQRAAQNETPVQFAQRMQGLAKNPTGQAQPGVSPDLLNQMRRRGYGGGGAGRGPLRPIETPTQGWNPQY
jgi:hypothetical protein